MKVCEPNRVDRVDYVWTIQPNGNARNVGVSDWNLQAQDELAPGAIVWAPFRNQGWSTQFSEMFAQLLSTPNYDILLIHSTLATEQSKFMRSPGSIARDPEITASDWGPIGLLQKPTALMSKAGEARFHFSNVYPYDRINTFFQPFDFFELGFRYTNIVNKLYGSAVLSSKQTYKDKSIDIKVRLSEETA